METVELHKASLKYDEEGRYSLKLDDFEVVGLRDVSYMHFLGEAATLTIGLVVRSCDIEIPEEGEE